MKATAPTAIQIPTAEENAAAINRIFAIAKKSAARADQARESLERHLPILIRVLRGCSDQPEKVRAIVWSVWNGQNIVGLCDVLCGLDHEIGEAVLALIEARLFMGGNADEQIARILEESGEMDRFEAAGDAKPDGLDMVYPLPLFSASFLRSTADTIEAVKTGRRRAA